MKKFLSVIISACTVFSCLGAIFSVAADSTQTYIKSNFPASYQTYLLDVHKRHPNWTFTALNTKVSLATAVSKEYSCKTALNLVDSVYADTDWACASSKCSHASKHNQYRGSSYAASSDFIRDCMDPRNNLTDKYIFQFENLSFSSTQTVSGIEGLLKSYGSFMYNKAASYYNTAGKFVTVTKKYSQIIYDASKAANANAYFITARITQEIGTSASSDFISGKYKGYEGYYNFFNINATGSNVKANALSYAKSKGWTSPEKAITGGTAWIASGYITKGQNTGYLQKFNVNPSAANSMYTHQYMQTVTAPRSEAMTTYSTYLSAGTLEEKKNFIIPVYTDSTAAVKNVKRIFSLVSGASLTTTAYVNCTSTVNVRSDASLSSSKVCSLPNGTKLTVLGGKYTDSFSYPYWYKVRFTYNGSTKTGYIFSDYVALLYDKSMKALDTAKLYIAGGYAVSSSSYSSSNSSIVSVSSSGVMTAKAPGTATIKVTSPRGKVLRCRVTVKGAAVKPSGITLNKTSLTLGKGETYNLTAKATNAATSFTVSYKSDNSAVKVDTSGKVTASAVGTATITATTNNGKSAKCKVTVKNAPTSLTLNKTALTLGLGEGYDLDSTVNSSSAAWVRTYSSSNTSVATVDSAGVITTKKVGTAVISCKIYNGKSAKCTVTVKNAPTSVTLNKTALTLGLGEGYDLDSTVNSSSAAWVRTYSSSNTSVATVNSSGIITTKKVGTAVISCKIYNGKTAKCTVTVKNAPTSIVLNKTSLSLKIGEKFDLDSAVNNSSAAWTRLYTSSNTNIATVNTAGIVSAKSPGMATVTVSTYNGKKAVCKVTVSGTAYAVVKSDVSSLRIRSGPGTNYSIVKTVSAGAKLKIISTSGNWYNISYTTGGKTYKGYVSKEYVTVKYN